MKIHADFNDHPVHGMPRRVNTFTFLNKDWNNEWLGQMELWNHDLTKCQERIAVPFNRFVVFNTNDFAYHGHLDALQSPWDRTRRSIATYYYSPSERPKTDIDFDLRKSNPSTLYHTTKCKSCVDPACQDFPSESDTSDTVKSVVL